MSEKVDIKKALLAFNVIITEGKRSGDAYTFNGVSAQSDFDGYAIALYNDYVRLDIYFHNKIAFTYSNDRERKLFLEKIESLYSKN